MHSTSYRRSKWNENVQRAPLTTAMEGDFDTGNVRYKARERYSFGVSDPRGIFGVEGA